MSDYLLLQNNKHSRKKDFKKLESFKYKICVLEFGEREIGQKTEILRKGERN